MKMSVHDKAVRLVEGGIVEVDGHCVRLNRRKNLFDPCRVCEMDCLCHTGTEMCDVCVECDQISRYDCFLSRVESSGKMEVYDNETS